MIDSKRLRRFDGSSPSWKLSEKCDGVFFGFDRVLFGLALSPFLNSFVDESQTMRSSVFTVSVVSLVALLSLTSSLGDAQTTSTNGQTTGDIIYRCTNGQESVVSENLRDECSHYETDPEGTCCEPNVVLSSIDENEKSGCGEVSFISLFFIILFPFARLTLSTR